MKVNLLTIGERSYVIPSLDNEGRVGDYIFESMSSNSIIYTRLYDGSLLIVPPEVYLNNIIEIKEL